MGDARKSIRARKTVDYSKFADGSDGDDDDFRDCTPPMKKAKISEQQPRDKIKSKLVKHTEKREKQRKAPKERIPVAERKFDQDLQAALELSKQCSQSNAGPESKEDAETKPEPCENAVKPVSTDSDFDSDGENDRPVARAEKANSPKKKAAPKDEDFSPDDGSSDSESESEVGASGDVAASDSDSDYEEDKPKKSASKPGPKCSKTAPKAAPAKKPAAKRPPVSRTPTTGSSKAVPRTPVAAPKTPSIGESQTPSIGGPRTPSIGGSRTPVPAVSTPKTPVPRTPLSSSGSNRVPSWTPPARISTPSDKPIVTKSPGSGLRLGLSRSARIKPLHANAKVP